MKQKLLAVACILISLFLMALPGGICMIFGTSSGTRIETYSYFSTIPFGYGNWMPALAILLSVVVLILLLIPRDLHRAISVCLFLSIAAHIISGALLRSFTPVGFGILLLQLFTLLLCRRKKSDDLPNGKIFS